MRGAFSALDGTCGTVVAVSALRGLHAATPATLYAATFMTYVVSPSNPTTVPSAGVVDKSKVSMF